MCQDEAVGTCVLTGDLLTGRQEARAAMSEVFPLAWGAEAPLPAEGDLRDRRQLFRFRPSSGSVQSYMEESVILTRGRVALVSEVGMFCVVQGLLDLPPRRSCPHAVSEKEHRGSLLFSVLKAKVSGATCVQPPFCMVTPS